MIGFTETICILGKSKDSNEMRNYLKVVNEDPEIEDFQHLQYHCFMKSGIAFTYDKLSKYVSCVFLYSDGYENYSQYKGELPNNISFGDNRAQVKSKLGKPIKSATAPEGSNNRIINSDLYEMKSYSYGFRFNQDGGKLLMIAIVPLES